MEAGGRYSSPWGEYRCEVVRGARRLVSIDRAGACILDPDPTIWTPYFHGIDSPQTGRKASSEPLPVHDRAEPVPSQVRSRAVVGGRSEGSPSESMGTAVAPELRNSAPQAHCIVWPQSPTLSFDDLTLGGMRPGTINIRTGGELRWSPCLTRAPEGGREHVWFLDVGSPLYCHDCRKTRPIVVIGRAERIARIREALEAGDLALAHELVRRINDPFSAAGNIDQPVHAEADTYRQPTMYCPACKRESEDFDGVGVVSCACGFCRHLARSGDVCDYCGHRPARDMVEWHELFDERVAIAMENGMSKDDAKDLARMLVGDPPRKVA